LGPVGNPVALNIERLITTLGYKAAWYNSIAEIDSWVQDLNYGRIDPDGLNSNICFAVFFDEYSPSNQQYSYKMMFNISGNPAAIEFPSPDQSLF
jgi:hypothetical protein